jgi:hypothetical protein
VAISKLNQKNKNILLAGKEISNLLSSLQQNASMKPNAPSGTSSDMHKVAQEYLTKLAKQVVIARAGESNFQTMV